MQNGSSDVLEQFRRGDPATFGTAFEALFHLHQRAVYGWILRIVRNPSAAEELTVETFWRIHQAHARLDPARGFEAWARTIATRAALDWMRVQRHETGLPADAAAPASGDPGVAAEIRRQVGLAFGRLPPKLRAAAVLAVVEEAPYREIADALGITAAAVKVRVFRALRLLRSDLEKRGIRP